MKNKNEKTNKIISILNYFTVVCFYICAIINLVNKDSRLGIFYLCLGTTFMCLGSVYLNKYKNNK